MSTLRYSGGPEGRFVDRAVDDFVPAPPVRKSDLFSRTKAPVKGSWERTAALCTDCHRPVTSKAHREGCLS